MKITQNELIDMDLKWKKFSVDDDKIFTMNIKNFITDEHIDIIVRYLYIEAYLEDKDYEKYKKLYEKMMYKRVGKSYFNEFNKIIDSFKNNGYLKKYPIPVNTKNKMLNGSHRLACCLYFNINPYVYVFDEPDHNYTIDWFKENDFTNNEIVEIINKKNELLKMYTFNDIKLEKIYTAMITPITGTEFDKKAFIEHANFMKKNSINGLFLCGNTGNGMNLNFDLKKQVLEYSNKMSDKFSLICHVGSHNIQDIEAIIGVINDLNITCIASMPPYKSTSEFSKIKQYYEYIAKISKKPVLIYHIPNITEIDLSAKEIVELLNINNVIGIKYTDANLEKLEEISTNVKNKYIFYGKDDLLLDGLSKGANAGIGGCYNLFPSFIYNIVCSNIKEVQLENQVKLNYCIKKLRKQFPTLPGSQFVLEALKIKGNRTDDEFYKYLEENYD